MRDEPFDAGSRYRVQLGHACVLVWGRTSGEALQQARRELCRDLPRLWDVIMRLADERFEVEVCSADPTRAAA